MVATATVIGIQSKRTGMIWTKRWLLQRPVDDLYSGLIPYYFVYHWRNLLQKDFLQMDAIASVVDELFLKYAIDGEGW